MTMRRVLTAVDVVWDGGVTHVSAGSFVDIPAGSALETAYGGAGNLGDLSDPVAAAAAAEQAGASN